MSKLGSFLPFVNLRFSWLSVLIVCSCVQPSKKHPKCWFTADQVKKKYRLQAPKLPGLHPAHLLPWEVSLKSASMATQSCTTLRQAKIWQHLSRTHRTFFSETRRWESYTLIRRKYLQQQPSCRKQLVPKQMTFWYKSIKVCNGTLQNIFCLISLYSSSA